MYLTSNNHRQFLLKIIKQRNLLTWSDAEWKAFLKKNDLDGIKDPEDLWEMIVDYCKTQWPNVDLEWFMESYEACGKDKAKEYGMYNLLIGSRNEAGKPLAVNEGDNPDLINLMRYLLDTGSKEDVPYALRTKWKDSLEKMESFKIDPAVVLLQFASAADDAFPYMPKYGESVGDEDGSLKKDGKSYNANTKAKFTMEKVDHIHGIIQQLTGNGGIVKRPPMLNRFYKDINLQKSKGLVRMDLINFVCGCIYNILAVSNSENTSIANEGAEKDIIPLSEFITPVTWWADDLGKKWKILDLHGALYATRYEPQDKTFRQFSIRVMQHDNGELTCYIVNSEHIQFFFDRKDVTPTQAFCQLTLEDKDGKLLLNEDARGELRTIKFKSTDGKNISQFLGTESLVRIEDDNINRNGYKSATVSHYDFDPLKQVTAADDNDYIYLPYETNTIKTNKGETVGSKIKTWFRIPKGKSYERTNGGDNADFNNLKPQEFPMFTNVAGSDGSERTIIVFGTQNVIIDVTNILTPQVGTVFPYGIMLVTSPTAGISTSLWRFSTIDHAEVVREENGKLIAKVTYHIEHEKEDGSGYEDIYYDEEEEVYIPAQKK